MSKKEKPQENQNIKPRTKKILPWAVFIPTVIIVLLSITPVVFPALITRSTSIFVGDITNPDFINPFEPGVLAIPLIITNVIILGIGFAYYKKRDERLRGIINKISCIEVSKKQAIVGIIILLAIFVALTASTLSNEETWVDYAGVKSRVSTWEISDWTHSFEPHFRYLMLKASLDIFSNIRVIPFIASATLMLLTYFFTKNITQKRFAGLVSMAVVLQSNIFVSYSTTASYSNFWILLYLFGLYLIPKFWPPSPVPYFISIFAKALTVAFLPMTFYFIARTNLPRKQKVASLISYGIIAVIFAIAATVFASYYTNDINSTGSLSEFWQGFSAVATQMRFDYVVILFILPLTVMLFFASRNGIYHSDSIMIFILTILFTAPLLVDLTEQTNQPYRFVSLVVFFAIGVGILLSKRTTQQGELLSNK